MARRWHRYLQWGLRGLVVADGDEIAKDLAADVSPFIEYFLGGRPVRISDLAGTENSPPRQRPLTSSMPLNSLAALARGSRAFPPYAATSSSALAVPARSKWQGLYIAAGVVRLPIGGH